MDAWREHAGRPVAATRRIRNVCLWLVGAVVLTGCGMGVSAGVGAQTLPQPTTSTAPEQEPDMVMFTLVDARYRSFDIPVAVKQPVMFMIVNRGTRPHRLTAAIPLTGIQIDDPAHPGFTTAGSPGAPVGVDVTVPAGQEIDVTFTPTTRGQFTVQADLQAIGRVAVQ